MLFPLHQELLPSIQRTTEGKLLRNSLDPMRAVDVLDQHDLETIGPALPGDDGAPRQKELPDAVPAHAVFGLDLVGVA